MRPTAIHPLKIVAAVGAAFLMWGLVLAYASNPAWAAGITVNTTDDNETDDGLCTLREAINTANSDTTPPGEQLPQDCVQGSGADTINFNLGQSATITLNSTLGQLTITDADGLTIDGGDAEITVSGGRSVRVFFVDHGNLTLNKLTVSKGYADGDENPSDEFGGGAYNYGGTLTISNSTFSDNESFTAGGGVATEQGTVIVTDSTFSDNIAEGGGGGGGIYKHTLGTLEVINSTFSGNSAVFGGGINSNGSATLKNTIVADNSASLSGPDVNGTFTSQGYNLIGDGTDSTGFTQAGDQVGTAESPLDPMLGPLQNNGGPTKTHALLTGSPAIDAIPSDANGCGTDFATDQRGVARPKDGDTDGTAACDIGAFELVVGDCQPSGSDVECTFDSPGISTWTVPEGVTQATFEVSGAQGGRDARHTAQGGVGGMARATIDVTPDDTLQVTVGGAGADGVIGAPNAIVAGGAGGFNGGAAGGSADGIAGGSGESGGGGGGASDIRFDTDDSGDFALAERIIVAGGGGGAGGAANGSGACCAGGGGGAGGGSEGGGGGDGLPYPSFGPNGYGGSGGSASSGGVGGDPGVVWLFARCTKGLDGTLGVGGVGGECRAFAGGGGGSGGGGGGGGYYGGGGGGGGGFRGGGGGGGSGFVDPQASDVEFKSSEHPGDGLVTITYTPPDTTPPTVSSIKRASSNPTNTTGNVDWTVTFSENVIGVDTSDFALASTGLGGTPTISNVSGSGANYTVTASTGTSDGTLGLNLSDNDSIKDGANNLLGGTGLGNGNFTGEVYTIDRTGPSVTLTDVNGSTRTFPYLTNQTVSSVGGSCENGASAVTVEIDGTADTDTAPCSSGSWSLTLTNALSSDGTYGFVAYQGDAGGNTGNSGASKSVQVDKTAPTVTPGASKLDASSNPTGAYTANTWTNQSVRVTFACADNTGGSGLTSASGNDVQTFTTETSGTTATFGGTCADNAGNTATSNLSFGPIKIDKIAPSVSCSVSPSTLRTSANNHKLVTITATVTVSDTGSGTDPISANRFTLVSVTSNQAPSGLAPDDVPNDIRGWTTGTNSADTSGQVRAERYGGARTYTLTYRGKDLAGNTAECKPTVTVPKGSK